MFALTGVLVLVETQGEGGLQKISLLVSLGFVL